jgi:hypothetical protein
MLIKAIILKSSNTCLGMQMIYSQQTYLLNYTFLGLI